MAYASALAQDSYHCPVEASSTMPAFIVKWTDRLRIRIFCKKHIIGHRPRPARPFLCAKCEKNRCNDGTNTGCPHDQHFRQQFHSLATCRTAYWFEKIHNFV